MVKLNYANRKVEGEKLGQIISKDLLKRLPPSSESGSKPTAPKDPVLEIHVVDKHLTDDVIKEISKSLVHVLGSSDNQPAVVRLEELSLASNSITVYGLNALRKPVEHALNDLRDLDLSWNRISVITDEDALAWEEFLSILKGCTVLRRLDLSGNLLGSRAFEILMRLYARQEPVDVPRIEEVVHDDYDDIDDGSDAHEESHVERRHPSRKQNERGLIQQKSSPSKPRLSEQRVATRPSYLASSLAKTESYSETQGLRSIPYIILSDTAMTDTCALHLSYLLEVHNLPQDLLAFVPSAKSGVQAQQLESYDNQSGCRGIIYRPNTELGVAGEKLLELAEISRTRKLELKTDQTELDYEGSPSKEQQRRRAFSVGVGDIGSTKDNTGGRLDSDSELERIRNRIQGNILQEQGASSVELWKAALRMLNIARAILVNDQSDQQTGIAKKSKEIWQRHRAASSAMKAHIGMGMTQADEQWVVGSPPHPSTPPRRRHHGHHSYHQSPSTSHESHVSSGGDNVDISRLFISTTINEEIAPRMINGLLEPIWQRIIIEAADPNGVLDADQHKAIMAWARSKQTLTLEQEIMGKPVKTQIWRVLCATGCLAYHIRE